MYHMIMKFSCDVTVKQLDNLLYELGKADRPVIQDAFTVRVEQTVDFVPRKAVIAEYEKIIAKGVTHDRYTVVNARFAGYDVFEEV